MAMWWWLEREREKVCDRTIRRVLVRQCCSMAGAGRDCCCFRWSERDCYGFRWSERDCCCFPTSERDCYGFPTSGMENCCAIARETKTIPLGCDCRDCVLRLLRGSANCRG
jgi:hypothetical protein